MIKLAFVILHFLLFLLGFISKVAEHSEHYCRTYYDDWDQSPILLVKHYESNSITTLIDLFSYSRFNSAAINHARSTNCAIDHRALI